MLGHFDKSTHAWQDVLKYNNLYAAGYNGLGMASFQQKEYTEAIKYFRLGNNKNYYSKAFAYYRKAVIEKEFSLDFDWFCSFGCNDSYHLGSGAKILKRKVSMMLIPYTVGAVWFMDCVMHYM